MLLTQVPDHVVTALGERHVMWLLTYPWGLAVARARAKTCTIQPEKTRPAYAELAELMGGAKQGGTR